VKQQISAKPVGFSARMGSMSAVLLVVMLVLTIFSAGWAPLLRASDQPKNVIIMFADGVGPGQLELGRYASQHLRGEPFAATDVILKQGSLALMTTHADGTLATDSAAAGTAMSSGTKTSIGTIGMAPDGRVLPTVMEVAKGAGKRIGLVTTATVYDATPAAFSLHAKSRRDSQGLVDQLLALEPDVLMGGGRDFFIPQELAGGKRTDGLDLVETFRARGHQVALGVDDLSSVSGSRLLGLFDDGELVSELDRDPWEQPSLAEMTDAALRALEQDSPNGFVLLIESENTDAAGHRNDAAALIRDLWAFDAAVQRALAFQSQAPGETLVLLAGDHETGGLSITYAQRSAGSIASSDRFYAAPEHLEMIAGISISLAKADALLGAQPSPEALDDLVATYFPGFRLDPDLRQAILEQQMLELNSTLPTANALGRMIARQTGFYWGTAGHSSAPVVVGALGPGADRFRGYLDNTDFALIVQALIVESGASGQNGRWLRDVAWLGLPSRAR
jgi:alkaline phosphatase